MSCFFIYFSNNLFGQRELLGGFTIEQKDTIGTFLQVFFIDKQSADTLRTLNGMELTDGTAFNISKSKKKLTIPLKNGEIKKVVPSSYSCIAEYDILLDSLNIRENKLNTLVIFFERPQLVFRIHDDESAIPPYEAKVKNRFNADSTVIQNCRDTMSYKTGNYLIEINTFPTTIYKIDLIAGSNIIEISRPGYLNLVWNEFVSILKLYYSNEGSWSPLEVLDLNKAKTYPLQLQPGKYKLECETKNRKYHSTFYILPTKTTLLEDY